MYARLFIALVAMTSFGAQQSASAEDEKHRGFYGGGTLEWMVFEHNRTKLDSALQVSNPSETTLDTNGFGYSIYAGYRFNRYVAADVGLYQFPHLKYHVGARLGDFCLSGCTKVFEPADVTLNQYGALITAHGSMSIRDRWTLDAHLGVGPVRYTSNDLSNSDLAGRDYTDLVPPQYGLVGLVGIGTSLAVSQHVWARIDYTHGLSSNSLPHGEGSYNSIGISFEYRQR